MKKILQRSYIFLIAGLLIGVYYREFTKFNQFTEYTVLRVAHGHVLLLGFVFPLLLTLLIRMIQKPELFALKHWNYYFIGTILTIVMMMIRGTLQVLETPLSSGLDASISGIAGIGHALLGIALVLLFRRFIKAVTHENA